MSELSPDRWQRVFERAGLIATSTDRSGAFTRCEFGGTQLRVGHGVNRSEFEAALIAAASRWAAARAARAARGGASQLRYALAALQSDESVCVTLFDAGGCASLEMSQAELAAFIADLSCHLHRSP